MIIMDPDIIIVKDTKPHDSISRQLIRREIQLKYILIKLVISQRERKKMMNERPDIMFTKPW